MNTCCRKLKEMPVFVFFSEIIIIIYVNLVAVHFDFYLPPKSMETWVLQKIVG